MADHDGPEPHQLDQLDALDDAPSSTPSTPPTDRAPQLKPHRFNSERAREAGKRSAAARRTRKALVQKNAAGLAQHLDNVREAFATVDLVETAYSVMGIVLARVAAGEIPVRHAGDAAELVRALHEVARLESGQPTAIKAQVQVGPDALDRLAQLQQQARAAIAAVPEVAASSAVPAAADAEVATTPDDDEHQADEQGTTPPPEVAGQG